MPDGLMFNFLCSSVSGTVNQSNHDGWIIIISPSNGHPHFENLIVRPYEQMIIIVSTTFSFRDWTPTAYSSYCVDRQIPLGKVNGSIETYVHNWDCCSTPSSPKGRRILQCPVRFYWTSRHRLRRNTYASATGYLVRRWRNKPTTRSSNSRHLCTAGGCRRAPSRWDRHSRTTAGNRVRRKSLCVVADLRRTGVNIPSILTIQTNRLPYSLNLFGIKEKVESFYKFESVKPRGCQL